MIWDCNAYFRLVVLGLCFISNTSLVIAKPKVLHLSFHKGCIKDFEQVALELGLDLTSWFILESQESKIKFDSKARGNSIYNIGHARAERVWQANKDYFNQFDVIVTSDTAPLSRIFLQNGWKKPLIIWICNRFDYGDAGSRDCPFPDKEYYDLFRHATHQKNVKVIGYVAYEHFFARGKGVDTGNVIIKPCGSLENSVRNGVSAIPSSINKQETFFIPPRMEQTQVNHLIKVLKKFGIKAYCGSYNGPYDLNDFKGIIHFPYAWSNIALFENLQLGIPYFVPSIAFLKELYRSPSKDLYKFFSVDNLELSEWYCQEHKDVLIYFDSWVDLVTKIKTIDFAAQRHNIKAFAQTHYNEMIQRWSAVFNSLLT